GITLAAPSYKTVAKKIRLRPQHDQALKRVGRRGAYESEPFYYELDMTTPRHGQYPFHICHIDHTELDIELRHSNTGKNMVRPWGSFLTDANTRRLLVVLLSFDRPSDATCMSMIRECVRKHSRLPGHL